MAPPARGGADVSVSIAGFRRDQKGGKPPVAAPRPCHLKLPLFAGWLPSLSRKELRLTGLCTTEQLTFPAGFFQGWNRLWMWLWRHCFLSISSWAWGCLAWRKTEQGGVPPAWSLLAQWEWPSCLVPAPRCHMEFGSRSPWASKPLDQD